MNCRKDWAYHILKCHNRIKNTNRQNIAKRQNILTMKQILNFKSTHFLQCGKNNCYLVRFLKKTLIRNTVKGLKVQNPIHASSYKHVFIYAFYTSFVLNSAPVFMN